MVHSLLFTLNFISNFYFFWLFICSKNVFKKSLHCAFLFFQFFKLFSLFFLLLNSFIFFSQLIHCWSTWMYLLCDFCGFLCTGKKEPNKPLKYWKAVKVGNTMNWLPKILNSIAEFNRKQNLQICWIINSQIKALKIEKINLPFPLFCLWEKPKFLQYWIHEIYAFLHRLYKFVQRLIPSPLLFGFHTHQQRPILFDEPSDFSRFPSL